MIPSSSPVFLPPAGPGAVDTLRRRLAPVLRLTEAEILSLIPERSGIYFVGCPNCDGGTQEGQISWSIEHPHEVFCKFCGIRYPNKKYPDDRILRIKNPAGDIVDYPYWEAPNPPPRPSPASLPGPDSEEGYRHFFQAKGWYLAREYFADAAYDLAVLHFLTGDRAYARRSALILNRFAEVYPGYCVHYDLPFQQKIIFDGDQGFPYPVESYRAAKWSWWAYMDIPDELVLAYDLLRKSDELDDPAKKRIEDDLIRASVAFVRAIPVLLGNMDPTTLRGLIVAGRVLGEPDYLHDAVDRIGRLVRGQFFVDGMWREGSVSYHNQTVGGLSRLISLLRGYTDPEGYVHPGDGERFVNLNLMGRFPILEKARRIPEILKYPNGRVVAFHDAWALEQRDPVTASGPVLLTGVGQARLGRGRGPHQMQAHLHFSGGYGHQHMDQLNLTLFSHGHERISDIGYTHTRHRGWTLSTPSHSTVTVDGKNQVYGSQRQPSDGNLELYVPGDETLQIVEASGLRAYPDVVRAYRRTLVLIGVSPEDGYLVDLFRVAGGSRHDYVLVGDADHDGALKTDLKTARHGATMLPPKVKVTFPTGESVAGDAEGHNIAYAYFRDVRRAVPSGGWEATFTSEAKPGAAVKVHAVAESGTELFFGKVPSIRRAGEQDGVVDDFRMPVLIARREGQKLDSLYVTVLEPFAGKAFLSSVQRLPIHGGGPDAAAIRVCWGDCADTLLFSGEGGPALEADGVTLQGRIGWIRERNGTIERMTLVGGTVLEKASERIEGRGIPEGRVLGVLRKAKGDAVDGLVVEGTFPEGDGFRGRTVIVRDGAGYTSGHEIEGILAGGGGRILELTGDPGFEMDPDGSSRHTFFPNREWTGENRYQVADVVTRFAEAGMDTQTG